MIDQTHALEKVDSLVRHPQNPNKGDVPVLTESVEENGFYSYLVCQTSTRHVLVGNHRHIVLEADGTKKVPVFWVDVDDVTAKRIMIADNRVHEFSGTDLEKLKEALAQLTESTGSVRGTGYHDDIVAEITGLLSTSTREGGEQGDCTLEMKFSEKVPQDIHDAFWAYLAAPDGDEDSNFTHRLRDFMDQIEKGQE